MVVMRLVLFQPDIPQNAGAILRLGACLGVGVDIVEPCGFVFDDRRMRRAGLDYDVLADLVRYRSWDAFLDERTPGRLILLSTRGTVSPVDFAFAATDRLVLGRESSGVPAEVVDRADAAVRIPLATGARSMNVVTAAAVALAEALRQTDGWPNAAGDCPPGDHKGTTTETP